MLEIKSISKKRGGQQVIHQLTFSVPAGRVLGIMGPNGAGKSTLLTMVAGLLKPDAGQIRFHGQEVKKDHIGYVPQEISLFEELSIKANLELFGGPLYAKKEALQQRIDELIKLLHLKEHFHKRAEDLSGGLRRRVNVAVALLKDPPIVIFDEPVVGIDYEVRNEIGQVITLLKNQGKTILVTSHLYEFLNRFADEVMIIEQGNIVYLGGFTSKSRSMILHEKSMDHN